MILAKFPKRELRTDLPRNVFYSISKMKTSKNRISVSLGREYYFGYVTDNVVTVEIDRITYLFKYEEGKVYGEIAFQLYDLLVALFVVFLAAEALITQDITGIFFPAAIVTTYALIYGLMSVRMQKTLDRFLNRNDDINDRLTKET